MHHHHHHGMRGGRGPRGFVFGRGGPWAYAWAAARGEDGRGGGRRRMFDSGELRLVLLKLIADQPRHGYDLIRAIEELTGGGYAPSPGVVYPTLTMLDDMGLIEERASEGAKKRFAVTDDGQTHLAERSAEVEALMARLAALGTERAELGGTPIWRAFGNLAQVLQGRMRRGGFSAELLHDVAEIIDDAARRIERL